MQWVLKGSKYRCTNCNTSYNNVEGFTYCPHCGDSINSSKVINNEIVCNSKSYSKRYTNINNYWFEETIE